MKFILLYDIRDKMCFLYANLYTAQLFDKSLENVKKCYFLNSNSVNIKKTSTCTPTFLYLRSSVTIGHIFMYYLRKMTLLERSQKFKNILFLFRKITSTCQLKQQLNLDNFHENTWKCTLRLFHECTFTF